MYTLRYHTIILIYSAGRYLFRKCPPVNPDILYIIRCLQSESAVMSKTHMNFQISGYRTALTKIYFSTKSGAASLPEKAQDVNDLRRHLIDARVGVKQSVTDNGIDQWRRHLHACIRAF